MKSLTLEIFVAPGDGLAHVFYSAPAFGDSHNPSFTGEKMSGVLRNDTHRVKFAVYGALLDIETVKSIARQALTKPVEKWAV